MQDQHSHLFAGETEADTTDWVNTINQALENTKESQKEKQGECVIRNTVSV